MSRVLTEEHYNRLTLVWNEVARAAELIRQIDPGEVFGAMTCTEAVATADIFRAAGDTETADHIINSHGLRDDDPDDQHHEGYLAAQKEQEEWDSK